HPIDLEESVAHVSRRQMLQYAIREHLVKAAVTERQVTAISHHVDGGDTKLARNPLCRAYAFQRRIDTHWPISGASCRHTPSAPTDRKSTRLNSSHVA